MRAANFILPTTALKMQRIQVLRLYAIPKVFIGRNRGQCSPQIDVYENFVLWPESRIVRVRMLWYSVLYV